MRVAVINCEDAKKWHDHLEIMKNAYSSKTKDKEGQVVDDEFIEYKAWQHELPTPDELNLIDGVIVPGAKYSANDELPWLKGVEDLLLYIVKNKRPQLFCNCFGHQVLAKALGGTVTKNIDNKFVFRSEEIHFITNNIKKLPYAKDLIGMKETLLLLESHGDCVHILPPNVTKIAQSKGSENEAFVIGDHVLSVQSHPEFNGAMITKRIFQTLCEKGIFNDEKEANECKESVLNDKVNDSNTIFRNVVRKFLNRDFTLRKNFL